MTIAEAKKKLLKTALAYPDAWKDHPWGETVVKVGKKVFVFFGLPRAGVSVTCKLPHTFDVALSTFSFAEATGYGLGASIWTRDVGRAMRVARAVQTGNLSINSGSSVHLEAPFGGVKRSGLGRELGMQALEHYTEWKTVYVDIG